MNKPLIARKRGCYLHVVSDGDAIPAGFVNMPNTPGVDPVAIRYAGGCQDIAPEVVAAMPEYFVKSHVGFKGVAISGGTKKVVKKIDPANGTIYVDDGFTITYVPALLASKYPCLAASTTPRCYELSLDEDHGGLIATDDIDRIDFAQHRAVIIQHDAAEITEKDWGKDVLPYLKLMQSWKRAGINVAVIACNGGGVTKKEIYWALEHGVPVIAIKGSGRQTDAFIDLFQQGKAMVRSQTSSEEEPVDPAMVSIVSFADPSELRNVLIARKLILA